jgi:hypothetical protein
LPQVKEPALFPGAPTAPFGVKGAEKGSPENSGLPNATAPGTSPKNGMPSGKESGEKPSAKAKPQHDSGDIVQAKHEETNEAEELPAGASTASSPAPPLQSDVAAAGATTGAIAVPVALPPNWPDERGFIPPPPSPMRPACCPTNGPVMTHTRIYHGNDGDFTEALASYYNFRDDARFGGWQNYLSRSDDFVRFCCHMHIGEMLSARGGASETRVVWRWSDCR